MEIKNDSPRTVAGLAAKFEALKKNIGKLKSRTEDKRLKEWMDSQDVLFTLNISIRNLQNLRDKGLLPYSVVSGKFYYRPEDVHGLVLKANNGGGYEK